MPAGEPPLPPEGPGGGASCEDDIDRLIREHLPLAVALAGRLAARWPVRLLGADWAEGEAVHALWGAATTYDPSRGPLFPAYAETVIRRRLRREARRWCRRRDRAAGDGARRSEHGFRPEPARLAADDEAFKDWLTTRTRRSAAEAVAERLAPYLIALAGIRDRYRGVIEDVHLHGHSRRWVAEEYGVAESTARVLLRNAIRALRRQAGCPAPRQRDAAVSPDGAVKVTDRVRGRKIV